MPVALVEQVDKLEDVAGVAGVRCDNVKITMRTFSHKIIKLTPAQIEDAILYFDRLIENQGSPPL